MANTIRDNSENNQLVSYYISDKDIVHKTIRTFLEQRLPEAMIPSFFVKVVEFPLNRNGKIDRAALPHPGEVAVEGNAKATTETQVILADIFKEVLGIHNIGIDQNFFEIGGHSLLAVLVCTRVYKETHKHITLERFYKFQTIKNLALYLDQELEAVQNIQEEIIIQKKRIQRPLSFSQERLWFMNKLAADDAGYNIPFAIKLTGSLNFEFLKQSIESLYQRHESLRTSFNLDHEGRPIQSIEEISSIELNLIKLDD